MPDLLGLINNIVLSDYNYQRDIENRLLMADLTVFDVEVLREILDSSLKNSTKQLAKTLSVTEKDLLPALNRLSPMKLFTRQGDSINVDKEMRKYYESQIIKFDEDFEPNMEFLQGLLSKVPIHALPNWYSVPRMTNNILSSIIENYLLTPKIYERYLNQLKFKDPVMKEIMQEIFEAPDFQISAQTLIKKHSLTREKFEELMLFLEYNFVCCLVYKRADDVWEEVVTPFYEWHTYLRFLRDTTPDTVKKGVKRIHPHDFGFVQDLATILRVATHENLKLKKNILPLEDALQILPHLHELSDQKAYVARLIETLLNFPLAQVKANQIQPLPEADKFLNKTVQVQAAELYRYVMNNFRIQLGTDSIYTDRDLREIERSLRRIARKGWVYFDEFMTGMIAPIGSAEPIVLQNKGKRWRYVLPTFSDEDVAFIEKTIFEPMFEAGMVATGHHNGKPCFSVTPIGRMAFGE
jgi:predicted transcriptional regulator